jgi:hypothetical protein
MLNEIGVIYYPKNKIHNSINLEHFLKYLSSIVRRQYFNIIFFRKSDHCTQQNMIIYYPKNRISNTNTDTKKKIIPHQESVP